MVEMFETMAKHCCTARAFRNDGYVTFRITLCDKSDCVWGILPVDSRRAIGWMDRKHT